MHSVIGCKGTLLKNRVGAAGPPDLVPADAGDAGRRLDRLVGHQRFVRAKVAVGETESRPLPVREDVEILTRVRDSRLRQAVAARWRAREDRVEAGYRKLRLENDGCSRIGLPPPAAIPDIERVARLATRVVICCRSDDGGGANLRRL